MDWWTVGHMPCPRVPQASGRGKLASYARHGSDVSEEIAACKSIPVMNSSEILACLGWAEAMSLRIFFSLPGCSAASVVPITAHVYSVQARSRRWDLQHQRLYESPSLEGLLIQISCAKSLGFRSTYAAQAGLCMPVGKWACVHAPLPGCSSPSEDCRTPGSTPLSAT